VVSRVLAHVEEAVAGTLLAVILMMILADVGSRTLTGASILWVNEVSLILFMWAIMVGGAAAIRRAALVSVDAAFLVVPARVQAVLSLAVLLLLGFVLGVLVYQGVGLVTEHGSTTLPTSGVPIAWKYAAVPVGSALMLLRAVQVYLPQAVKLWTTRKKRTPQVMDVPESA
jgi:TRAP-type C4-dicarboxylate transport system permease small subunit